MRQERPEAFNHREATLVERTSPGEGAFRSWRRGLEWWRAFMWSFLTSPGFVSLGPTRYLLMTAPGYWSSHDPAPTHDRYSTRPLYALMAEGREQMIAAEMRWAGCLAMMWLIGSLMTLRLVFKPGYRSEGAVALTLGLVLLIVGLVLRSRVG